MKLIPAIVLSPAVLCAQGPMPDLGVTKTPEQRLEGRVLRGETPVANAVVRVAWRRLATKGGQSALARDVVVRETQTNAEGRYSVVVPAWRMVGVYAVIGDEVSGLVDSIQSPFRGTDLVLAKAKPIEGRFVQNGRAPKPVRFTLDMIGKRKDSMPLRVTGTSDADGAFRVTGMPPGKWQLRVMTDDRGLRPRTLEILENGALKRVDLIAGDTVKLQFVEKNGAPSPDVEVELIDFGAVQTTRADANGHAVLRGLERGHGSNLIATPKNTGARRYYSLEPGREVHGDRVPEIRLEIADPMKTVRGRLFGVDGKAASGKNVIFRGTIHGAGYPPEDFSHVVKTDAEGNFECSQLDQLLFYEVETLVDGEVQPIGTVDPRMQYFREKLDSFRIGSRRFVVDLKLPAGGPHEFELRCYGPKLAGDLLAFQDLVRGKDGKYVSPSLKAGEFALFVVSKTLGFSRTTHSIRANLSGKSSQDVRLSLGTPRTLEGRVTNPGGKPATGASVALVFEGAGPENQPKSFADTIALTILDEEFPAEKFPRKASADANGKFKLICYESNGNYDLLVSIEQAGPQGQPGPPPTRMTRILAVPNPINIVLR